VIGPDQGTEIVPTRGGASGREAETENTGSEAETGTGKETEIVSGTGTGNGEYTLMFSALSIFHLLCSILA